MRRPRRDIDTGVTTGNQRVADALVATYLAVYPPILGLEKISQITGVPLSDLFGAVRRRFKGEAVVLPPADNPGSDRAIARAVDELVGTGRA